MWVLRREDRAVATVAVAAVFIDNLSGSAAQRPILTNFPSITSNTHSHAYNMADKLRAQQQLEALQARYIGIGSADTTKHEWTSNIARDSLSSYVGHPPLLQYMSIGLGQSREKTRVQLLERMVRPVGPPPEVSVKRWLT